MAIIQLSLQDRITGLRTKFNQLSTAVGDITLLQSNEASSVVQAINGVDSDLSSRIPGVYDNTGTLLND